MRELLINNTFYCVLFFISGIIILETLKLLRLRILKTVFKAVFLILLSYVPFFFLSNLASEAASFVMEKDTYGSLFLSYMYKMLSAPFIFVKTVSTGTAVIAVISIIVATVALFCLFVRLFHYVRNLHTNTIWTEAEQTERICRPLNHIRNDKNIYKILLRLRN